MPPKEKKHLTSHPKLADPSQLKWPLLSSEKESCIVGQLEKVFDEYKDCLQTEKKPPKWKKIENKPTESFILSEENKLRKDLFKSYFVIGINAVIRNLEKDKLRLVMICKSVSPSMLKNVLLTLVNEHQCPAICVPNLLLYLQKSWPGLSSATAFGVLKSVESNDFDSLVQEVESALKEAGYDRDNMFGDTTDISEQITKNAIHVESDSLKEVQKRPSESTKNQTNVGPPIVDCNKYYVYKKEKNQTKSFDGQEFISFGTSEVHGSDNEFQTINGKRISSDSESQLYSTYGIRPALSNSLETSDSRKRPRDYSHQYSNKKPKFQKHQDHGKHGQYKKINIKKMKINQDKKSKKQNTNKKMKK